MDACTEAFISRIDKDIEASRNTPDGFGTVDIWMLLGSLALDIIGSTAFGESFNMVETNDHFIPIAITRGMRFAPKLVLYPFLGKLVRIFRLNRDPRFDKVRS